MKIWVLNILCLFLVSSYLYGEPLTLEPAGSVLDKGRLEIGVVDAFYTWKETEEYGVKRTTETIAYPLFFRCGITDHIEVAVWIPNIEQETVLEMSGGVYPTVTKGTGDADLFVKYILGKVAAVSVKIGIPSGTGNAFRHGTNLMPIFSYKNLLGGEDLVLNLNLAYNYTYEYEDAGVMIDPQDELIAGIGLEYLWGKNWTFISEFTHNSLLTEQKKNGTLLTGTTGIKTEAIVGVRMKFGSLKIKLGAAVPFSQTDFSEYDYKFILGLSYIIGIFAM